MKRNAVMKCLLRGGIVFVFIFKYLCYNVEVAAPRQARKGGLLRGYTYIIYDLCRGRYCCLFYLQMAGRRKVIGNQPKA